MNLELKHLAPYLPYGLIIYDGEYKRELIITSTTYNTDTVGIYRLFILGNNIYQYEIGLPLLRPLSDLTKEIDVDGWFIPAKHLFCDYRESLTIVLDKSENGELLNIFLDYDNLGGDYIAEDHFNIHKLFLLFEWHFDVFGLIEKGLAIDINTIEK